MNWTDSIGGLLQQYAGQNVNSDNVENHFDQVTQAAPSASLGGALADMFRSSDTPPFAQLAGQLFGNANGAQKSGVLSALLAAAGSNLPSILESAGMGALAAKVTSGGSVTPEAAESISPDQIQQMAQQVEKHDPSIVDRLGAIYSEHPDLIKTLGSAVLAVTLAKIANRTRS